MMKRVRPALGWVVVALTIGACGTVRAQGTAARPAAPKASPAQPPDAAATASMPMPRGDPDAEVAYLPPRRVIAPPVYGQPGPPLNPGGVPYDELFASPYPFDLPSVFVPPDEDPYPY